MARELKKTETNKMVLFDKLSGTKIELYYRTVTSDDRIKYKSAILNQLTKSQKIEDAVNLQLAWAEKIITGFKKGDFTIDGKPISANKTDKEYYEGWFGVLKETATDLILVLIETVLGETSFVVREQTVPFEKS